MIFKAMLAQVFADCNQEVLVLGEIPLSAYELVPEAFPDGNPFDTPPPLN